MKTVPILYVRTFFNLQKKHRSCCFAGCCLVWQHMKWRLCRDWHWELHALYNYCDCKTRRKEKTFALYDCLSRKVGDVKMRSRFCLFTFVFPDYTDTGYRHFSIKQYYKLMEPALEIIGLLKNHKCGNFEEILWW